MPIQVFVADEQSDRPSNPERIQALATRVLEDRGLHGDVELNVLLVDEEAIASLNRRFLGHEGPTDVLSFPIETGDDLVGPYAPGGSPGGGPGGGPGGTLRNGGRSPNADADPLGPVPLLLGDVVICPAVAERNAASHTGTYDQELALLVVHGILHLLGMDHAVDDEAEVMEALERDLLRRFHHDDLVAAPEAAERQ